MSGGKIVYWIRTGVEEQFRSSRSCGWEGEEEKEKKIKTKKSDWREGEKKEKKK